MKYKYLKNFYNIILLLGLLFTAGCPQRKQTVDRTIVNISTIPEGASILYKNNEKGVTPVELKFRPGTYIIKLEKLNYEPQWVKIICSPGKHKSIEVDLKPVTASVLIESKPAKALVVMNGKTVGETPLVIRDQKIGRHKALVKKVNYVSREISWEIADSRPRQIKVDMNTNLGTLKINTIPSKANLKINGTPRGTTPFSGKLEPGKYKLEINKSGYISYKDSITVLRDKTVSKTVNLNMRPGSLVVKTTPPGANVYVNDRQYQNTPTTIKNLQPGKYSVKLVKSGYDQETREVTVHPGAPAALSINLDANTGGVDLVVNPPGVTIYFDGKKVGVSQPDENKKISKVFSLRSISAGDHTIEFVHKRAQPQKKRVKIKVRKGQVARPKNVNMWIANAVLKLKNGKTFTGRLHSETNDEIFFEPEPGVRQGYSRTEVLSLKPLKREE